MENPGLPALLALVLFAAPAFAQPAPSVDQARETLARLDAAVSVLQRGDHDKKERRAALDLLVRLQPEIAALQPPAAQAATPRGQAWTKLDRAVVETVRREREFWTALPNPDAVQKLPVKTAEPLARGTKEISTDFDLLFPRASNAVAYSYAAPLKPDSFERRAAQTDGAVARARARGAAASSDPKLFFDGGRGGSAVDGVRAASAARARLAPSTLPVEPETHLRTAAVPAPSGEEQACRQAAGGGMLSKTCGSKHWKWAGPFVAGLGDAIKGTAKGLVIGLALAFGALAAAALLGGVPAILKLAMIIKRLANWAAALAAAAIVYQLVSAVKELLSTSNNDPKHWFAMRKLGAAVGEAALLAAFVFGVGTKAPDTKGAQAAIQSAETAAGGEASEANVLKTLMKEGESAEASKPPASKLTPPEPQPEGIVQTRVRPVPEAEATEALKELGVDKIKFSRDQLQHEFKHAGDFEIAARQNNQSLAEFQNAILKHMQSIHKPIVGKYRQTIDVIHLCDPETGINVMLRPNGEFLGAWKLNAIQLRNVLTRGML